MKRCKAVTSRVCDSIECCLLAEHEGAHEGQRDAATRAVWTNPDAPEYLPTDGPLLPGSREEHEHARTSPIALPLELPPPFVEPKTAPHCACGAERSQQFDPTVRTPGGMPLVAWTEMGEADQRFQWARCCRDCGAVYCQRWPQN
jgi:hypothetical protein